MGRHPAFRSRLSVLGQPPGRPINDITTKFSETNLFEGARNVLTALVPQQMEMQTSDGHWYSIRIFPYRNLDGRVSGVVITFVNISQLKESERGRVYAENIIDAIRQPLLVLDKSFKVVLANKPFYQTFRTTPKETEQGLIYDVGNGQWDIPRLRELLEEIIPKNNIFEDFAVTCDFPEIGRKTVFLNATTIKQRGVHESLILLTINDITGNEK